jgi:hypothetical protein
VATGHIGQSRQSDSLPIQSRRHPKKKEESSLWKNQKSNINLTKEIIRKKEELRTVSESILNPILCKPYRHPSAP